MTTNKVLDEILQIPKPYLHIGMPQSTFSNTVRNIRAGNCKLNTIQDFFSKFGYSLTLVGWDKD